ncbi:MAG TPA: hypothetical protein VMS65_10635, partial [Polyangiaceae bacterium]|nr:hypothetical protein [Polyangiaceae bacterium]
SISWGVHALMFQSPVPRGAFIISMYFMVETPYRTRSMARWVGRRSRLAPFDMAVNVFWNRVGPADYPHARCVQGSPGRLQIPQLGLQQAKPTLQVCMPHIWL